MRAQNVRSRSFKSLSNLSHVKSLCAQNREKKVGATDLTANIIDDDAD